MPQKWHGEWSGTYGAKPPAAVFPVRRSFVIAIETNQHIDHHLIGLDAMLEEQPQAIEQCLFVVLAIPGGIQSPNSELIITIGNAGDGCGGLLGDLSDVDTLVEADAKIPLFDLLDSLSPAIVSALVEAEEIIVEKMDVAPVFAA